MNGLKGPLSSLVQIPGRAAQHTSVTAVPLSYRDATWFLSNARVQSVSSGLNTYLTVLL
jgi:hypothetical protein